MEKENKKEEIQSRREFFKNAAKSVLPIIGAVTLLSNPVVAKTIDSDELGCDWGCSGRCSSCSGSCYGSCSGGCSGCSNSCKGACVGYCSGGCQTGCTGWSR